MRLHPSSDSSTFSTYSIEDPAALELSQNETYTLAEPGPVPDRQDVPHLHDAILDPTGQFLLVPDLGSDFVRVYAITPGTIEWVELDPIKSIPGSGPRHGAFAVFGGEGEDQGKGGDEKTFFYVVNELSNTITGYAVTYGEEATVEFEQLFDFSTHGPGGSVPNNTKAAEIEVSVSSSSPFPSVHLGGPLTNALYARAPARQQILDAIIARRKPADDPELRPVRERDGGDPVGPAGHVRDRRRGRVAFAGGGGARRRPEPARLLSEPRRHPASLRSSG